MIKRINLRFCVIHFLAAYCLCYSFFYLALIPYEYLIECMNQGGLNAPCWQDCNSLDKISYFLFFSDIMKFFAIIISLIMSCLLSYKKGVFWINPFMVFISIYLLYYFDILGWQYAKYILSPILLLDNFVTEKVIAAFLLMGMSFFLWYSPITNRFIKGNSTIAKPAI
jgi:hypothetical protein